MRYALLFLALMGCGPDKEMVQEKERLEVRVKDLEQTNARLEKEGQAWQERITTLEGELRRFQNTEVFTQLGIPNGGKISANMVTSLGTIHCELWPVRAPKTVVNFVTLAEGTKEWEDPRSGQKVRKPLYDGTIFHRVIPGFMIQGGDPLGKGTGGPGFRFEDEFAKDVTFDRPGLLAMANAGPNTNGSQFFITDGTPTHLNGKHTIFGACQDLPVVKAISAVPRGPSDKPDKDVVLKKVQIVRGR